jgi:DNA topoisomerase-2
VYVRQRWLNDYVPETNADVSSKFMTISDFVTKELILFFIASNVRTIPALGDGLVPIQRKIIHTTMKRGSLLEFIGVTELAGCVSVETAYHHGIINLHWTIIKLAQNFVGSNNINLLEPLSHFGTRNKGGNDAGRADYIQTSNRTIYS